MDVGPRPKGEHKQQSPLQSQDSQSRSVLRDEWLARLLRVLHNGQSLLQPVSTATPASHCLPVAFQIPGPQAPGSAHAPQAVKRAYFQAAWLRGCLWGNLCSPQTQCSSFCVISFKTAVCPVETLSSGEHLHPTARALSSARHSGSDPPLPLCLAPPHSVILSSPQPAELVHVHDVDVQDLV